jgi:alpha-methylacyl-CoA racemase
MYKPLKNITIVTLALNLPGPLAAKRFVELGARVIKVEPPQGDPFEQYCPDWYAQVNHGQQREVIDVKSAEGRAQLDTLLSSATLLLTAQRPAALERLGLGWNELHEQFPHLNHLAVVGYPAPNDNHAGHDLTYQAALGLLSPPHVPKTLVADLAGAERAAFEGMAMIMGSQQGERGRQNLVALSEAADYMAQPLKYGLTSDGALLSGVLPEYTLYETLDGWVAVAALEPHFRANFKQQLGLDSLTKNDVAQKLKQKPSCEWVTWANEHDIPLVEVK